MTWVVAITIIYQYGCQKKRLDLRNAAQHFKAHTKQMLGVKIEIPPKKNLPAMVGRQEGGALHLCGRELKEPKRGAYQ